MSSASSGPGGKSGVELFPARKLMSMQREGLKTEPPRNENGTHWKPAVEQKTELALRAFWNPAERKARTFCAS